jgi:hypothetical protein
VLKSLARPQQQRDSIPKPDRPNKRQRMSTGSLAQDLGPIISQSQALRLRAVPGDTRTLWLTSTPAPEGPEMLLVQLTDADDTNLTGSQMKGDNKVMYFGNDSIWSYSLQKARRTKAMHSVSPQSMGEQSVEGSNMHYSVPSVTTQLEEAGMEAEGENETLALLRRQGAFSLPPTDVQRTLLAAYFKWVYPLQPILDKEQFDSDLESCQVSMLLLQALFSLGCTCCDDDLIREHWSDRRTAQSMFYRRARLLYDADYEQDRITIVQALFFMSHWWGSPTDVKDFSHWLSTSIHMAQVMGMHRS